MTPDDQTADTPSRPEATPRDAAVAAPGAAAPGTPAIDAEPAPPPRVLSDVAKRALAEAEERRRAADAARTPLPPEVNGRGGPEPVRYGDWEVKGIISDF